MAPGPLLLAATRAGRFGIDPALASRVAATMGWGIVIWIVVFWRLGYASFWDPDEAHYAQATREMLASGNRLTPVYNSQPFFDKPILFYLLQMAAFSLFGASELAARLVPALSAVTLIASTAWVGTLLFGTETAVAAALMLALLPATLALSGLAILDMTFTAFLFPGVALVVLAALRGRPRLQYPGYALVALAVVTKGPLALVLAGLAFPIALVIAPGARRPLLGLHWIFGLLAVVAVSSPWFLYMWWRFGWEFIEGYLLRENIWLYARPLYARTTSHMFYLRLLVVGTLPWTPLLVGRLVDVARRDRLSTEERLLWAWVIAVTGFFSFSQFKFDHYLYPCAPALCLLAAHAWNRVRHEPHARPGTTAGAVLVAVVLVGAGIALGQMIARTPLEISRWVILGPVAFIVSGIGVLAFLASRRWRQWALLTAAAGILTAYAVVRVTALPGLERAKPIKELATWVVTNAPPSAAIATYRLHRWNSSWRFYVGRHTFVLDTPEDFGRFLQRDGAHYCVMVRHDYDALVLAGYRLSIVRERAGVSSTTGRALRRDTSTWPRYLIVTDAPDVRKEIALLGGDDAFLSPQ